MKKFTPFLIGSALLFSTVACTTAKTSSNAPGSAVSPSSNVTKTTAANSQDDATSEVRRRQLNSDVRAAEQRNNVDGGDMNKADGDLRGEVRSKLEANLPASALTVNAKDGAITVGGTVVNQAQLAKIEPLAKQIKGVQSVTVNVTVAAAAQPSPPASNTASPIGASTGKP
jgi:hyperosmotically inducible periplasmic protein